MKARRAVALLAPGLWVSACVLTGVDGPTLDSEELRRRDASAQDAAPTPDGDVPDTSTGNCGAGVIAIPECASCIATNCCAAAEQCFGSADCQTLVNCAAACSDATCGASCSAAAPSAALARGLALKSCMQASCAAQCPPSQAAQNRVGGLEWISGGATVDCTTGNHCANTACADCNGNAQDFCETILRTATDCGACGRSCGSASCDPRGFCLGESVVNEPATGVAIGAAGLLYLADGFPNSGVAKFIPSGSSTATMVGTGYGFFPAAGSLVSSDRVAFGSYTGAAQAPLPAATGAVIFQSGANTSVYRQLGAQLFTGGQGASSFVVWRWQLPGLSFVETLCLSNTTRDVAVDVDGTVYAAATAGVLRAPTSAPWGTCSTPWSGATVLPETDGAIAVAVGATRVAVLRDIGGAVAAYSVDKGAGGNATLLGPAKVFTNSVCRLDRDRRRDGVLHFRRTGGELRVAARRRRRPRRRACAAGRPAKHTARARGGCQPRVLGLRHGRLSHAALTAARAALVLGQEPDLGDFRYRDRSLPADELERALTDTTRLALSLAKRPKTGTITSPNVRYAADAFEPLDLDAMERWGLV